MPTAYVTVPPSDAETLAERLVAERLAACVNRIPCRSTYRWDGEIHRDDEEILFVKTTDEGYQRLVTRIEELHPYEVPCVERIDETDTLPDFARWREEVVRDDVVRDDAEQ